MKKPMVLQLMEELHVLGNTGGNDFPELVSGYVSGFKAELNTPSSTISQDKNETVAGAPRRTTNINLISEF